ncbi:FMN-binding negative transcriptional regulator [Microcella sp.]|uniref:FMN-binding negative transcriptional regulator n=1 Tax=Microcella sp. TaxID=1913979 RepID=UPI00391A0970
MRHTPHYVLDDRIEIRRLVRENPWATIVSHVPETGIVASHYPVLLDEAASTGDDIVLVSHVGRPDEQLHRLGESEVLVIAQGPHGYISPSWYAPGDIVPTWNHVTAHLYGVPEILDDAENFRVLADLTDHFERAMGDDGRSLAFDEEYSRRVARGTVGLRLRVTRIDARLKLSQNKSAEVVDRIIDELEGDGPYAHAGLAREMRRVHDPRRS